ncbi:hypothetical protein ACXIUS_10650 [Bosea thiooxidans]|nr:hypothetical protein [Bosea sp. (in: a-proteobacteria)]
MFAGTLGRSQFFVRSSFLALVETAVLFVCIAVQHEAFFGPPGEGRYRLAASVFLASAFFGYMRISFAIRRNRDAGGGELVAGIYVIATCMAIALQIQALIIRTSDTPMNGMEYAGLLYFVLGMLWLYLQFAASAPLEARSSAGSFSSGSHFGEDDGVRPNSSLSQAMEQVIAGRKPLPAPLTPAQAQPQGFLGSIRQAPAPRQRTEFGRRSAK